jgi:hypothetical protein
LGNTLERNVRIYKLLNIQINYYFMKKKMVLIIFSFIVIIDFVLAGFCDDSEEKAFLHMNEKMDMFHSFFDVFTDNGAGGNHFHYLGKLGGENAPVEINNNWKGGCYRGQSCIRNEFSGSIYEHGGWSFQNGYIDSEGRLVGNWGEYPNMGFNLNSATEIEFWARGEKGGEKIDFFAFGIGRHTDNSRYPDSSHRVPSNNFITLSDKWEKYTIDIRNANKSYVIGGFSWYTSGSYNTRGAIFYLDDIRYKMDRLNETRFIQSYQTIKSDIDFDKVLENTAYVYDNSVAIIAYLSRAKPDDMRRAKILADAIVYAQENDRYYTDGRIRNAYRSGDIALSPGWSINGRIKTVPLPGWWEEEDDLWYEDSHAVSTYTGNVAWAMLALIEYYKKTADKKYLNSALKFGDWINENTHDDRGKGGYTGGYDGWEPYPTKITWKSTEHNINIYVAFMKLYLITQDESWRDGAIRAKNFVDSMWNEKDGHFWTGTINDGETTNRDVIPSDVQTWGLMAMGNNELMINYIENNFFVNASGETGFSGFDFNNDLDGVWWEGTAHASIAFQIAGEKTKSDYYLDEICKAQILDKNGDGKGIVSADRNSLSTGFNWEYFNRLHIGSTAWYILAKRGFNPYWGISTTEKIPYSGDDIVLTGDVNGDCRVDIFDLAIVGKNYGAIYGQDGYDHNADLNSDGKIDIFDLAIIGKNYGDEC